MSEFLAESGADILIDIIRTLCNDQDASHLIKIFSENIQSLEQDDVNNAFSAIANEGYDYSK